MVRDTRYESLRLDAGPVVYLPIEQPLDAIRSATLTVRGPADPGAVIPSLRAEIHRSLPGTFVGDTLSLEQAVAGSLLHERIVSLLASVFGALALTLSGVGLYGLISFSVVRRTPELGIRLAIGAQRGEIVRLVLKEAVVLVGAALVCGVIGRAGRRPVREGRAVRRDAVGPARDRGGGRAPAADGIMAAYVPARRASRTDVIHALRRE